MTVLRAHLWFFVLLTFLALLAFTMFILVPDWKSLPNEAVSYFVRSSWGKRHDLTDLAALLFSRAV